MLEDQIKRLQERSEELKRKIEAVQSEIDSINEYQINSKLEKERFGFDTVKIRTQAESRQSQIEEKRKDIQTTVEEINRHKEEIAAKGRELASFDEKISVFDIQLEKLENEENALYEELSNIENNIIAVRKEEELIAPLMMDSRSAWDKKATEMENKQRGQQYILDNIANIKQQIEAATNRTAEDEAKLSELLTSQETETIKIQQYYEEQAKKEAEIQLSLTDKENLQDSIDAKTDTWHEMRSKADALNAEVNAMQIDLKNFEYQKNDLEKAS